MFFQSFNLHHMSLPCYLTPASILVLSVQTKVKMIVLFKIFVQIHVTFHLVFKTVVLPLPCLLHPPCTTTTTVPGVPDYRHGTMAPPEEAGLLSTATLSSGYRLTWEQSLEWRGSVPRGVTMPTSLSSPTLSRTARRVISLCLTGREGRQGYADIHNIDSKLLIVSLTHMNVLRLLHLIGLQF